MLRQEPRKMAPDHAVLPRRVQVLLVVGMGVVMPVMSGPPQRSTLDRCTADDSEEELDNPPGAERAVREVAVIKGGQGEDAGGVEGNGDRDRQPAPADQEDGQTAQVHAEERHGADPVETLGGDRIEGCGVEVETDPSCDRSEGAAEFARLAHAVTGFQVGRAAFRNSTTVRIRRTFATRTASLTSIIGRAVTEDRVFADPLAG